MLLTLEGIGAGPNPCNHQTGIRGSSRGHVTFTPSVFGHWREMHTWGEHANSIQEKKRPNCYLIAIRQGHKPLCHNVI